MPSQTDSDKDTQPQNSHPEKDYVEKSDAVPVEEDADVDNIPEEKANSDETLAQDENEAIDEGNIIKDRTRHAKPEGGYKDPDESEIPEQ